MKSFNAKRAMEIINKGMKFLEIVLTVMLLMASGVLFAKNIYPTLEKPVFKVFKQAKATTNLVPLEVKELLEPEFELMVRTVYAEAGNQGYEGKRLVAAVILNRVDDEAFPDTITEVLEAPRQFSVVKSGAIYKYDLDEETIQACKDEMKERTNTEIVHFNAIGFINGHAWKKVGAHYFSTK